MDKLIDCSDKKLHGIQQFVKAHCEYGAENFCDGRINATAKGKNPEVKPPCLFFIDGECSKKLHTGRKVQE